MPGVVVLVTAALFATGCGSDQGARRSAVRDSAGVTIVENALPAEGSGAVGLPWRVAEEPSLEIGAPGGPDEYQLYRVRGVSRLSDGSIAVVNGGTNELRVYGPDGAFRGAAGGQGDGPGEFRAVRPAGRLGGDTLLLFDPAHNRFTRVAPGPSIAGSFPVGQDVGEGPVEARGVLAGERPVVNGPTLYGDAADATVLAPPRALLILDRAGGLSATLDTFPTRPVYIEGGDGFTLTLVPFAIGPQFAVGDSTVYVGTGDTYEVRGYDARSGRLTRLIRLARAPRPVTDADLAQFVERAVARADPDRGPALRQSYDAMPIPERMPAYRRMLVDRTGDLWVADYRAHDGEPWTWTVFDPDGRVLGSIRLPDAVYVHEIGPDWILGVRRDELDIPYVVLYGLDRAGDAR